MLEVVIILTMCISLVSAYFRIKNSKNYKLLRKDIYKKSSQANIKLRLTKIKKMRTMQKQVFNIGMELNILAVLLTMLITEIKSIQLEIILGVISIICICLAFAILFMLIFISFALKTKLNQAK